MHTSDSDLVRRALDGDTAAFGRLVDRYKDAVYGTAYARLGDFQDAQDMAQEAFIRAYRRLASLKAPERFAAWLHTIVCNLCRDHLRARRDTLPLDERTSPALRDPSEEHDRRALHRRIQEAIAALSEVHRETVTLYYIDGYTGEEVGRFLNVPTGTVKRRLSDARKLLRKEMIDMVRALALRTGAEIRVHKAVTERAGLTRDGHRRWRKKEAPGSAKKGSRTTGLRKAKHSYGIRTGDKLRFAVKSRRKFIWESSHPEIVTVTPDGVVEGLAAGSAAITGTWVGRK